MTRRDYIRIAAALSAARPLGVTDSGTTAADSARQGAKRGQWLADCGALADALAADNPRFDRARFYAAAGGAA
jgi:hypothetical protein